LSEEKLVAILDKALLKARESTEILGMADDLKEGVEWKAPTLAENMKGLHTEEDSDDENDSTEDEDQKTSDRLITNADVTDGEADNNLMRDLEMLHDMKAIDNSVKKKAKSHLLSRRHSVANVGIPINV
jgi:hypothetical protein